MNDSNVNADSVSVVIPPSSINPNLYDSIDKEYLERTWDEILSDEASFNSSFDEYSGTKAMDGTHEMMKGAPGRKHARKDPGHAKSPYFESKKPSKKRTVSRRDIIRIDSDSDEEESVGEKANALDTLDSASSERVGFDTKQQDAEAWQNDVSLDRMEADAFALLGPDDHSRLVYFIAEQPFFKSSAYPVKRSERREFVRAVRQAATDIGISEITIEKINAYVKKLYLTACGWGHACTSGSEYGDEIDDEPAKIAKSAKKSKKDRKRKRAGSDKSTDRRANKTTDSSHIADCQALKSNAENEVLSERTTKPILDSNSSNAQIPKFVPGSLRNTRETVLLDSSDSAESAPSTPTKQRTKVKESRNKRSLQALSKPSEESITPPDQSKSVQSPEVDASPGRMLKELSCQHTDNSSRLNPGPTDKTTKRRRQRRESRKTRKASYSLDNPRDSPTDAPKNSQAVSTVAPKKSKPTRAASAIFDDSDSVDLDF